MIDVYLESSTEPDGIPTNAQLVDTLAYIDSVRPATAVPNTLAITRSAIDIEITGLIVPNEASVQIEITNALESYFLSLEPYILGLSVPPRRDRITESSVAGVVEDVVTAAGGIFELVNLSENAVEFGFKTLASGEKAKAGAVSFA